MQHAGKHVIYFIFCCALNTSQHTLANGFVRPTLLGHATHFAEQSLNRTRTLAYRFGNAIYDLATLDRGSSRVSEDYDFIVVGAGAAGCPLARTLADTGASVLLIERGGLRQDHPFSLDITGTGRVLNDPVVSQVVVTAQGVRSHIGNVLSGGTAINMAIVIEETQEYFDFLEKSYAGVKIDRTLMNESYRWVKDRVASQMPNSNPYGEAWRRGLEANGYGPYAGYATKLAANSSWGGYSLFNASNNWFRSASDVLLGVQGEDMPPSLNILLNHTVSRVEFMHTNKAIKMQSDNKTRETNQEIKASCILYHRSTSRDYAPIVSRPLKVLGFPVNWWMLLVGNVVMPLLNLLFSGAAQFPFFANELDPTSSRRVCVREGGNIILSAGAILTPVLLFKSGVGPKEFVDILGVEVVKEIPQLGQNISDRVLIPVGLFHKADACGEEGCPARVCQSIGAQLLGPTCSTYEVGSTKSGCSFCTAEELSGSRIAEGTIYATRYIFPPERRSDPVVEYVMTVLRSCSENRAPFGRELLRAFCPIVEPIIHCFRRVSANFYFTAEPKSRGAIIISPEGQVMVNANYMMHPQDVEDAIRGVSQIIRLVNGPTYEGIFETPHANSCPVKVLNSLVNFATKMEMSLRRFAPAGDSAYLMSYVQRLKISEKKLRVLQEDDGNKSAEDDGNKSTEMFLPWYLTQQFSTYPPTLPDPDDDLAMRGFVLTWMTSIWHWVSSAPMGDEGVVNNNFKMHGFSNLLIVDASVLNQVTRMNPTATLLALGRYAGVMISRDWVGRHVEVHKTHKPSTFLELLLSRRDTIRQN